MDNNKIIICGDFNIDLKNCITCKNVNMKIILNVKYF